MAWLGWRCIWCDSCVIECFADRVTDAFVRKGFPPDCHCGCVFSAGGGAEVVARRKPVRGMGFTATFLQPLPHPPAANPIPRTCFLRATASPPPPTDQTHPPRQCAAPPVRTKAP